jgi:hypothetical protein
MLKSRFFSTILIAASFSAAALTVAAPAQAGGWGHGPSFRQVRKDIHPFVAPLTPVVRAAVVAGGVVVGTAAGTYVGQPVAGGVVGGALGQGVNNFAAGER